MVRYRDDSLGRGCEASESIETRLERNQSRFYEAFWYLNIQTNSIENIKRLDWFVVRQHLFPWTFVSDKIETKSR